MTSTYKTGNPLGSTAPKDLFDNASNFDEAVNSTSPGFHDRFDRLRLTWAGAEYEWRQFLQNSGFEIPPLVYVDGSPLVVSRATQVIERSGSIYRVKLPSSFPVTLTGTWATDQALLVDTGDFALRSQLAGSGGASLVGAVLPGGLVGTVQDFLDGGATTGFVTVVGAGVGVDRTAQLQAAVDAWAANRNLQILVQGTVDVQGTVQIPNKETDDPETALNFVGGGTLCKFNAGFMFTKQAGQQLPDGTPLQTGHIVFLGTRFRGARLNGQTFILDGDNIIRTKFLGCFGYGINVAYAANYLQSIYIDSTSVFRKWGGWLIDCGNLFDVRVDGTIEAGDSFLRTRTVAADPACNSLKVSANIEGLSGKVYSVGACWATVINGNYHEGNAGGDYDFSQGSAFHKGLTIIGCGFQPTAAQLADPSYYPVKLGQGADGSITLIGNASTGNLFDVAATNQSAVVDMGNFVAAGKNKFSATSPRRHSFENFMYINSLLPGIGANLNGYHSSVGFENTRATVGGESITAEVTYGSANPQTSPGSYTQTNWKAGTMVFNSAPTVAARQYGAGTIRNALILGWQCLTSGAPGSWQEVAILLPY